MRNLVLPKISVIIPTLNEEKYLPKALASLAKLNYPGQLYEIILVDNGSSDRTLAIAQNHGIDVIVDAEKTVAGLRNLGASRATGDLLAFLDADCSVTEDWLLEAAKYYHKTGIVAWGSPAQIPPNATWVQKTWYLVRQKSSDIQEVDWLESMNLFVRKKDFQEIGGFDEALVTCEDVDFCYRLSKFGTIISDINLKMVHYGEAESLTDFFKKELWRGTSNYKGLFSHGLKVSEVPSLFVPLYYPIFIVLVLLSFMLKFSSLYLLVFIVPPILLFLQILKNRTYLKIHEVCKLLLLIQIYFISRTIALLFVKQ